MATAAPDARRWPGLARRCLALALVAFGLAAGAVAWDGLHDQRGAADLAVVLGNLVDETGQCSPRLAARLDCAIEIYRAGLVKKILVSGGIGASGFDEAAAMSTYLAAHSIPSSAIIQDHAGNDTFLTARHTAQILREQRFSSVLVISQWFHVPRCKVALSGFHVSPVYTAHPDYFELRDGYALGREVFGFIQYKLRSYN